MRAGYVEGDRESQSDAARLQVTALIEPMERPECFLAPLLGDSGSIVFDGDLGDAAATR
jgi:hypothetical protein